MVGFVVAWGLTPSLSRIILSEGANWLRLLLWLNPVTAVTFLTRAIRNRTLPRFNIRTLASLAIWAINATNHSNW